ncbi:MAG: HEPN domain-containing protein [Candidatus Aminicenantes bacterium]|nr:HEPN domain-containing protein [Candidatus Aminicenantes bacterium]
MNVKKNIEEAKRLYEAAEDDLDSCGILLVHKKHAHACLFARQAALKALQAAYCYYNTGEGENPLPGLLVGLRYLHRETFRKLEKFIPAIEKLEKYGSPAHARDTTIAKEESDSCVNAAYHILAEIKALIAYEDPS